MKHDNPLIEEMTIDKLGDILKEQFLRIDRQIDEVRDRVDDLRRLVDYIDSDKVGYKELDERLLLLRKTLGITK